MTAQLHDQFRYQNANYDVAGISDRSIFNPAQFDLEPVATSTICWRGYKVLYALSGKKLVVKDLHINLFEGGEGYIRKEGRPINGVLPTNSTDEWFGFNNCYEGIKCPLSYTGGLLLADGFIRDRYVQMDYHPAWKYEQVVELLFERGTLMKEEDRSDQMAEVRQKILDSGEDIGTLGMSIPEFVARSFDRTYSAPVG